MMYISGLGLTGKWIILTEQGKEPDTGYDAGYEWWYNITKGTYLANQMDGADIERGSISEDIVANTFGGLKEAILKHANEEHS